MKQYIYSALCALFFCFMAVSTNAQSFHNVDKLTNNNIREFVLDLTQKANEISSLDQSYLMDFYDKHLHPKAFFKSSMNYLIPGYPTQENSVSFNKEKYIESLFQSSASVDDFEAEVTIQNIKISKDKRKATLETMTSENAIMKVPQDGGIEYVPMVGYSKCEQILMLSDHNYIQIYSANCSTQMEFE